MQIHLTRIYGIIAIVCYVIHSTYWIVNKNPSNIFWACHLGSLLVGIGCLLKNSRVNAVGVFWLIMGNIMWGIYLLSGGKFYPTSFLTHVIGLIVGIIGIKKISIPKYSWIYAVIGIAILQILTRFLTVESENVNLAFRIYDGWEHIFLDYRLYEAYLLLQTTIVFFLSEKFLLKRKNVEILE